MKLLQLVQSYMLIVGVHPPQPNEKQPLNRRNLGVILYLGLFVILTSAYISFDASTFEEYTEAFFLWITVTLTDISFALFVLSSSDMFQFIGNVEKTINSRKCQQNAWFKKNHSEI